MSSRFSVDLAEVAAWTSSDGGWQEHATFLMRTVDGRWHGIGFGDPGSNELVRWLQTQPGFAADELLELIGESERRIVTLWRSPAIGPREPLKV